jgi:hypothetical protein
VCTEIQIRVVDRHIRTAGNRSRSANEQSGGATGVDTDRGVCSRCRSAVWRRGRR